MPAAQQIPAGSYTGRLAGLPIVLHCAWSDAGQLTLTFDSPDQGAYDLECTVADTPGRTLEFTMPAANANWSGALEADDVTLAGKWTQGSTSTLNLVRDTFVASARPSRFDGIWLGTLTTENGTLGIQLIIKTDQHERMFASLDSLDQHKTGLAGDNINCDGDALNFDVPSVSGKWTGTLSADGNTLTGRWLQLADHPLEFARQTQITRIQPLAPPHILPELRPVPAHELSAQLAQDLGDILTTGWLSPGREGAVVIGISQHGERTIEAFGAANTESIFEIGSVTKTFTALLLAQMAAQGEVRLDDAVRQYLPLPDAPESTSQAITLRDLATHHSGLPRMPSNMQPANHDDPYADYDAAKLLAFIESYGTSKPDDASFNYSNLGAGLLGYALANRAKKPFFDLLAERVLDPLGLIDTTIDLSEAQQARFTQGHRANGHPSGPWKLNALEAAGALRATANDLLVYLEAFYLPRNPQDISKAVGDTLNVALEDAQKPRNKLSDDLAICLGWLYQHDGDTHFHTGGTGGYTSYAAFSREKQRAIVVLVNAAAGDYGTPADVIGRYLVERLSGRPAIWPGTTLPVKNTDA